MSIEIKAPNFPESVEDGEVLAWHRVAGEAVERDELLVEIETDKVVLEVLAPQDGVLSSILKGPGETVLSEELIGAMEAVTDSGEKQPAVAAAAAQPATGKASQQPRLGPAARRLAEQEHIDVSLVPGTGKDGLVTKADLLEYLQNKQSQTAPTSSQAEPAVAPATAEPPGAVTGPSGERVEKRVAMTRMRKRIAERLLNVSRDTAMLTTFNEVNMAPIMALRNKYKEQFQRTHNGTRLGLMGFFVKAACEALKRFPSVNASIDGDDIVYHGYQDIGVAVSTEQGLVVPVLRDADFMSVADIEARIHDLGSRARAGKLGIDEMTGGTFTLTNGGVFGSLLSTPILNPPQTAILGMHKIQDRPMAVNGEVVILPMMYLALSYDHRLIDGKDAVQFLVAIKDLIEDPARILLQL
ncbi:MAG: 2-oxoglutarate dehydrogenase complex dihydrolipoyllysine-residue succinyltransferase [Halieaceae bacterium]|nr:2-oxoglutarate dehydrogenase complex dihydrolipoyllysine-residue succinyltransferase [Halieaceae bacterium]